MRKQNSPSQRRDNIWLGVVATLFALAIGGLVYNHLFGTPTEWDGKNLPTAEGRITPGVAPTPCYKIRILCGSEYDIARCYATSELAGQARDELVQLGQVTMGTEYPPRRSCYQIVQR